MSNFRLTETFPPHIKPVRKGVYKISSLLYAYWNGHWWGLQSASVSSAYYRRGMQSGCQSKWWQGRLK